MTSMKRSASSKPGCKGDPRMNRAVQARLENPAMPLYHALRIGGFNFPANEDVSTLDNDRVTLGQRKNQLLRRLRQIARRQEKEENEKAQQQPRGQPQLPVNNSESLFQHLQQQHERLPFQKQRQKAQFQPIQFELPSIPPSTSQGANPVTSRRRSSLFDTGGPLPGSSEQKEDWWSSMTLPQNSLQASLAQNQIHQVLNKQETPVQANPPIASTADRRMLPTEMRTFERPQASLLGSLPAAEPQPAFQESKLPANSPQRHGQTLLSLGAFPPYQNASSMQQQPQAASASTNFPPPAAQPIQQQATTPQDRESAALSFFQLELKALYSRSMLSAGYAPEETNEKSPSFRQFAFHAWKQECERLQGILGDDSVGGLASSQGQAPDRASL